MRKKYKHLFLLGLAVTVMAGCSDDNSASSVNPNENIGKATGNFTAAEWYPGGEKGTTSNEQEGVSKDTSSFLFLILSYLCHLLSGCDFSIAHDQLQCILPQT
ncbi:hypothetical protein NG821_05665, partial [Prevotella cerevisiae]|nr:hypothetical protein [Segatella cerevisiae]